MAAPAVCVTCRVVNVLHYTCVYICVTCVPLNIVRSHTKPQ